LSGSALAAGEPSAHPRGKKEGIQTHRWIAGASLSGSALAAGKPSAHPGGESIRWARIEFAGGGWRVSWVFRWGWY